MSTPEQRQREDLLRAVWPYIDERGINNLNLDEVAVAIGIDRALLREFFDSEEDLIAEIVARGRIAQRALVASMESDDTITIVERRRREWREFVNLKAELRFFFEAYALAMRDTRYKNSLHGINDWLDLVSDGLVRRGMPPGRAKILATLLIAMFRGVELDLLATGDRERLDAAIDMWCEAEAFLVQPR